MTVNHRYNFVNPETLFHTQKVQNLWFLVKIRNKTECGTRKTELNSYFFEFLWKKKFKDKDFFMTMISVTWSG